MNISFLIIYTGLSCLFDTCNQESWKIYPLLSSYLQSGSHNYNFPVEFRGVSIRCRNGSTISRCKILWWLPRDCLLRESLKGTGRECKWRKEARWQTIEKGSVEEKCLVSSHYIQNANTVCLPNRTHLEVGFGLLALESAISGLYFRFELLHTAWKAFVTMPLTRAKTHFLLLDALVLLHWCRYLALSPFWAFAMSFLYLEPRATHPFLPSPSASSC